MSAWCWIAYTISATIAGFVACAINALVFTSEREPISYITILLLTIYVSEVKLIQIIDKVNCGITITNSYQGVNVKSQIITKTIMSVATKDNIKQ